jgi:hypothetical protein
MNTQIRTIHWFIAVSCLSSLLAYAQHSHFQAGIIDTNSNQQPDAGEPLQFVAENGSGRTFHLSPRPFGFRPLQRCGGYYMLDERPRTLFPDDAFSFVALSDGQYEIEAPNHAHTGAWIWCEIVSVTGPESGNFGFWDDGRSFDFDTPSVEIAANQPTGNPRFAISEGFDDVDEDPSGHIHGRAWTADKPGDYIVSFRLIDLSTSGPNGGPWHPPSQIYTFHFKAGPDFQPKGQRVGGHYVLTWSSGMGIWEGRNPPETGIVFSVLRSSSLEAATWTSIGSVTGTTAATITFTDTAPLTGNAFYKLSYDWAKNK